MATDSVRLSVGVLASAISGVAWAGVARVLVPSGPGIGPPLWSGLLAAPVIGTVVGQVAGPFFRAMGAWGKGIVALVSLYVAVVMFALAIPLGVPSGISSAEHFYESVAVLVLGVTFSGLVLILWPLAVLNFLGLSWLDRKLVVAGGS